MDTFTPGLRVPGRGGGNRSCDSGRWVLLRVAGGPSNAVSHSSQGLDLCLGGARVPELPAVVRGQPFLPCGPQARAPIHWFFTAARS